MARKGVALKEDDENDENGGGNDETESSLHVVKDENGDGVSGTGKTGRKNTPRAGRKIHLVIGGEMLDEVNVFAESQKVGQSDVVSYVQDVMVAMFNEDGYLAAIMSGFQEQARSRELRKLQAARDAAQAKLDALTAELAGK